MEGGGKPLRGRMGGGSMEGLSAAEMKELEAAITSLVGQIESVRTERNMLQTEIRELRKEAKRAQTLHDKLALQLQAAEAQREALEERMAKVRSHCALSDAEQQRQVELTKVVKKLGKRVAEQRSLVEAVDSRLTALQEEVLAVGGTKLRAQKSKVETLAEQVAGLRQSLTKTEVNLESRTTARDKLQVSINRQKDAIVSLESQVEAAEAALKQLEDDAFQVHQAYQACEVQCASKEEALKAMQVEYENFKATVAKVCAGAGGSRIVGSVQATNRTGRFRTMGLMCTGLTRIPPSLDNAQVRVLEVDLSTQIDDYQRSIKEHKNKAQHWQQKLVGLRESAAQSAQLLPPQVNDMPADAPLLPTLSEAELQSFDANEAQAEIGRLEDALQQMSPNLSVRNEYRTH